MLGKVCNRCNEWKPVVGFYKHPKKLDGLFGHCKECHKTAVKLRARTDPYVQEYERERAKQPHRAAKNARNSKRWRADHPEAYRAQNAVNNAIRDGKLTKKPCQKCGGAEVHAHHQDYSKPLEVEWFCALHHHRLHADEPERGGHFDPGKSPQ